MRHLQGHAEYTISVLIETDEKVIYRTWRGHSVRNIKRKAREHYQKEFPGAKVSFGKALPQNFYGAH